MSNALAISIAWFVLAASVLALLFQRHKALVPLREAECPPRRWPTLSVIVPARNEGGNLAACLKDLAEQTYPAGSWDVHVVDDSSVDDTYQLAAEASRKRKNIHLHRAGPLPEGWLGKPHACWIGAAASKSEWLCFIDADTRLSPGLLRAAMLQAEEGRVDLLSLHPHQQMLGFWERILMPVPFMTLMILMDAGAINDPESPWAMANGQFILVRRAAYEAVGGHRAIASAVLDDVRLAELVKGAGCRIKLLGGGDSIQTRMYSDLRSLWQGLARGGSELFGMPLTVLAALSSTLTSVFPLIFPLWLGLRLETGQGGLLPLGLAILGSVLWYTAHALELRRHRVPLYYLSLLPISYLLIAAVNVEGVIRRLTGSRIWKERRI